MKLRRAFTSVALLATLFPCEAGAHRHEPKEVVSSFVRHWNRGDAAAIADLFESNADYHQPFGSYASGRDAIQALLRKTAFADLGTLELAGGVPTRLRFLNPSLALVEWEARLSREGAVRARLLLVAVVVPRVAASGGSLEWSFSAFRMIEPPTDAARR